MQRHGALRGCLRAVLLAAERAPEAVEIIVLDDGDEAAVRRIVPRPPGRVRPHPARHAALSPDNRQASPHAARTAREQNRHRGRFFGRRGLRPFPALFFPIGDSYACARALAATLNHPEDTAARTRRALSRAESFDHAEYLEESERFLHEARRALEGDAAPAVAEGMKLR